MRHRTADDFDRAHDLRKNWEPEINLTPQQHADLLLAEWQSRRSFPVTERLENSMSEEEALARDMAVRDLLSATDTLIAFAIPPADPKLGEYIDALELAHERISRIIHRITNGQA
jgi:hypothetical protein